MAAFHSTPMHDPGLKKVQRPARVCVCKGASVLPFLLSCCCWRRRPPAVRRSRLCAAPTPDVALLWEPKSVECLNSENPRGEWYCFPISIPPSPLSRADAVRCTIHLRLALSRQMEPSTKSEGRKQGSEGRGPADEKHRSSVLTNIRTLREMLIRDQCNNEIELRELHQFFAQRHPRPRTCAHPTQPRLLE